ncbi:MAG TPA: XrtN system VIT domain-containing protein, partial [Flavisolibacter sp.]|nr:XrtN system VIT domain-containing protein [Flavisolibacter sp.]
MDTIETRTTPLLHDRLFTPQAKSTSAHPFQIIKTDKAIWGGWVVILLSALVFCIPLLVPVAHEQYMLFFFFNFGAAIGYQVVLWLNRSSRIKAHRLHYRVIKLVLLLISAYALNREMEVFAASPTWFSILLVALCINYLAAIVFYQMPAWLRHLSFVLHGVAFFTFGYLAIYLLPLYAISIPALLFFGISLHSFVPLLFCLLSFFLLPTLAGNHRRYWISFSAGLVAVFLYCLGFTAVWTNKLQLLNRQYNIALMDGEDKLPLWVQVAQAVERDGITEKILKTNLVYKIPVWNDFFLFNLPTRNFGDEQQVHDPRVVLATLFSGQILLPDDDRIKILESQYNARHQALERLWTGENLRTEQVSTNVKVWPAVHLAYTEKTLTVS